LKHEPAVGGKLGHVGHVDHIGQSMGTRMEIPVGYQSPSLELLSTECLWRQLLGYQFPALSLVG
jgi:hypothetical protein